MMASVAVVLLSFAVAPRARRRTAQHHRGPRRNM